MQLLSVFKNIRKL